MSEPDRLAAFEELLASLEDAARVAEPEGGNFSPEWETYWQGYTTALRSMRQTLDQVKTLFKKGPLTMSDAEYSQLDIEAASFAFVQAVGLDKDRNNGAVAKSLDGLLADADLIWKWMAAEYQPPTPAPGQSGGSGTLSG